LECSYKDSKVNGQGEKKKKKTKRRILFCQPVILRWVSVLSGYSFSKKSPQSQFPVYLFMYLSYSLDEVPPKFNIFFVATIQFD